METVDVTVEDLKFGEQQRRARFSTSTPSDTSFLFVGFFWYILIEKYKSGGLTMKKKAAGALSLVLSVMLVIAGCGNGNDKVNESKSNNNEKKKLKPSPGHLKQATHHSIN